MQPEKCAKWTAVQNPQNPAPTRAQAGCVRGNSAPIRDYPRLASDPTPGGLQLPAGIPATHTHTALHAQRPSPGAREKRSVTIPGFGGTCVTGHPVAPFARDAGQSLRRAVSSAEATVALSLSRFVGTL